MHDENLQQQNEKRMSELLIHVLLIEYVVCYYLDYNIFLLLFRSLQIASLTRLKRLPADPTSLFLVALFSNFPAFFFHIIFSLGSSTSGYMIHFFVGEDDTKTASTLKCLFVDMLITILQYFYIVVKHNIFSRQEEDAQTHSHESDDETV